ncbi:IS110 family transposase [Vreelandella zhaodongensis]|uniref:IS110 family transposase n=1 Tax=Vreelandella zhaodongensis TaxID=1176240 RepID=UPI003EBD2AC4
MADNVKNSSGKVMIAIDIAKTSHDAVILWPSGRTKTFKFPNTLVGYQNLIHAAEAPAEDILVAFEPTADFHRNIAYWLRSQGVLCHMVSSLACARAREMLFKSWDKNDKKDARVIMYLMQQDMMQPFYDPLVNEMLDIQELANTYYQISLARSRCQHSLFNHYLTLFFPEMERFFNSTRAVWFCRFLLKFPTPLSITRYKKTTFVRRAWVVVGRKVAKQRFLEEIYEVAEQSIALPVPLNSPAIATFKLQIGRYLKLTEQRQQIEDAADQLISHRDDYQRLRTLPGIGPIIALVIIAESGDLKRFCHYRQYLSFCGFNLSASQSGKQLGHYRLSKRGNARLRYAFWLAATVAIRQRENTFRQKYERYIRATPDDPDIKRKARVAVAVKLARVAHALIKTGSDYRGYYEFGCET